MTIRAKLWPVAIIVVAACLWPRQALATPVLLSFSGTLDVVWDMNGLLDESIVEGASFDGGVAYDTDTAVDLDPDPTIGLYQLDNPLQGTMGSQFYQILGDLYAMVEFDASPPAGHFSRVTLFASGNENTLGISFQQWTLVLLNENQSHYSDDELPAAISIDDFTYASMYFFVQDTLRGDPPALSLDVRGTVDAITAQQIPEPASLGLFVALACVVRLRHRHFR